MIPDKSEVITHENPAWRERANFIIVAKLDEEAVQKGFVWEQLWARELGENMFEICCIPFFYYGIALGDIVATRPDEQKRFVISERLKTRGHFTLRVWFRDKVDESLVESIESAGCMIERRFRTARLISIDAPSLKIRSELEQILDSFAIGDTLFWENGS